MIQAPTPGPLSVGNYAVRLEDHPLVKAGEVHRVTEMFRGGYLGFARPVGGEWNPSGWRKCDTDGWMPWSGGENPVPGQRVEVRCRDGIVKRDLSGIFAWSHSSSHDDRHSDIIAFRLAPVASGGQHSSGEAFHRNLLSHEDNEAWAALSEAPVAETAGEAFQPRVHQWLLDCFGWEIAGDRQERGDRLLEEVLELLQSGGYDPARVAALRDYVWGRPVGEPAQEVGGVMVTLAAYCVAHDLDMLGAGETELARIVRPEIVQKIRAKQAAKPTGSALPIAVPAQDDDKALKALQLHDAYLALHQDRGGPDGPKGRAHQAWLDAKAEALAALKSTAAQEGGA